MSIRQIYEIPGMEQIGDSNDYGYSEDYVGKLFKFENKYVLFRQKNYDEFPCDLINVILEAAKSMEGDDNFATKEDIKASAEANQLTIEHFRENISDDINATQDRMNNINKKVEEMATKIGHLQSPDDVKSLISSELTSVYENYEKVIKKLINEKAEELAEEIQTNAKKLDPVSVMMYKKMGFELPDIIQMAQAGLL